MNDKREATNPKVLSLAEKLKSRPDRIVQLARQITALLGQQQASRVRDGKAQVFDFSVEQLVAIELAHKALMMTLERTLGPVMLNSVVVEADHRSRKYRINWPAVEERKTYLDFMEKGEQKAEVVPIHSDETTGETD